MHPFPGEEERSAESARNLEGLFGVAEPLHNFWLTHPKDKWIQKSRLPTRVVNVAAMLDVQASRLFRSVIEECRRCEAYAASIITRSLFETVLALRFVLARRYIRLAVGQATTRGGKPKVDAAGKPVYYCKPVDSSTPAALIRSLTRKKRADLFLAHLSFENERDSQRLATIPRMKAKLRRLSPATDALVASWEKDIGPEWSSILHSTHKYSGLSVETLAKLMGRPFERWYLTVYHFQSHNVHAVDLFRNIHISEGERLHAAYVSSDGELRQALAPAITMFFIAIATLQKSVGYGPCVNLAYASLVRRYRALQGHH